MRQSATDTKFYNSKRSPQSECDQENCNPNTSQKMNRPQTIKKVFTGSSGWSSSNTGDQSHSTTNDEVETSCFNLGPQRISQVPLNQQLVSQQKIDLFISQKNIFDAILYLQEFEDIDWTKSSQISSLMDIICKGDKDSIRSHTIAMTQIITSKQYLLSKHIIKTLFNNAFKIDCETANEVDALLEQEIFDTEQGTNVLRILLISIKFYTHQASFLPLILYTHSQHLINSGRLDECWNLLSNKLESMKQKSDFPKEEWEKTVQKICEMILRSLIDGSSQQKGLSSKLLLDRIQEILKNGVKSLSQRPNDIFFNKLIDFSFKNKQVRVAETLYLFMTTEININPTIVTINTLIDQYFKNNLPEKAWEIFESLKTIHKSIKPDNFTYTTLINGLKSNRDGMDLNRAFTLFEEYKQSNQPDQIIYNCLLDACINAGDLQKAYSLLDEMKASQSIQLDEITYNTLIKGCGRKKRLNDAISLFEEMKQMGIRPNRISFNSLLDSCVKCNRMNIAWRYYEEMTKTFNIVPDNFTYSILVNGIKTNHSNREELLKAIQLLQEIQDDGSFKADEILYNSLIDACVKFNEINRSLSLFEEMKGKGIEPSSVTYGILIKAYGKKNELGKAFQVFEEMKTKQVCVNDVTYGCLVDACIKNDRLDMALKLIEQMKRDHISLNTVLYTTLIKGFAKSNQIDEAINVFNLMKLSQRTYPNLITYNSLLDGLVKSGKIQEADKLFQEMVQSHSQNTRPDLITYSTFLKGHCKRGDMQRVKELVEQMVQQGIQPDESLLQLIVESCLSNQNFSVDALDQICPNVKIDVQRLVRQYLQRKNFKGQAKDRTGEQFGQIIQKCAMDSRSDNQSNKVQNDQSQWRDADTVLKDVSSNFTNPNYTNKRKQQYSNKENYQTNDENCNQSNFQRNNNNNRQYNQPKKQNQNYNYNTNTQKKYNQENNDIEDFLPKKSSQTQWRVKNN